MDEVSIENARPKLGDLVRDAQRHGIATRLTLNGKPAAVLVSVEDADRLAEINALLARFDWEQDDRQYALEQIEQIMDGSRQ